MSSNCSACRRAKYFSIASFQYGSSSSSDIVDIGLIACERLVGDSVGKYFTCTDELHIVSPSNKNIHSIELRRRATICSQYLSPSDMLNTYEGSDFTTYLDKYLPRFLLLTYWMFIWAFHIKSVAG